MIEIGMKKSFIIFFAAAVFVMILFIAWRQRLSGNVQQAIPAPTESVNTESLTIRSSAFGPGGEIPVNYTCDGNDARPALTISGIPADTKTLGIVMYDPDAPGGTFVHWVAWNIPPETREIPEGPLNPAIMEGTTSFQSVGYLGPCPPSGTHRYVWRLYALRTVLSLDSKTTREGLETAINTYVITQTELTGRYTRK